MSEESKVKSKWTTRRKLLVAFALLAGVFMVATMPGLFWELHEAYHSFHSFTDALIAKDYTRAYGSTAPELRAVTDYNAFVKMHENWTSRMGDLRSVEVSHGEINDLGDGWWGNMNARMVFAHGSLFFTFILKKENGSWKIYSYHEQ